MHTPLNNIAVDPEHALIRRARAQIEAAEWRAGPTPQRVGRYLILSKLAEGGMGVVYRAEQDNPRREVALKVISPGHTSSRSWRRFESEIEVLARMQDPGIINIFDAGIAETEFGRQAYFAMELVDGHEITTFAQHHALSTDQRLELLIQVCDAIQHAHQRGILHRDLKPSNVLVDDNQRIKVLDFGVARVMDRSAQNTVEITNTQHLPGTLPYMSPEQVDPAVGVLDVRSDVYSLGVLGYQLLTGHMPYDVHNKSEWQVAQIIKEAQPAALSAFTGWFPRPLELIFAKALEKDPDRRFASAAELASELRRYLLGEKIQTRGPTAWQRVRQIIHRYRRPLTAAAGLTLGIIMITTAAYWYLQAQARRESDARQTAMPVVGYAQFIQNAADALHANNVPALKDQLARCTPSARDWEWYWLNNQAQATPPGEPLGVSEVLATSPDGNFVLGLISRLVSARPGINAVVIMDARTRTIVANAGVVPTPVERTALHVAVRNQWAAICFPPRDVVRVVSLATGEIITLPNLHDRTITALALAGPPDNPHLVTAGAERNLHVHDIVTDELLQSWPIPTRVTALAASPAGHVLAAGDRDGLLTLWDLDATTPLQTAWIHNAEITHIRFAPTANAVATASEAGALAIFDHTTGQSRMLRASGDTVLDIAWSHDGTRLALATRQTLQLYDTCRFTELAALRDSAHAPASAIFSSDHAHLLTGTRSGLLQTWPLTPPPYHTFGYNCVQEAASWSSTTFNPDGSLVAGCTSTGALLILDARTGAVRRHYQPDRPPNRFTAIDFLPHENVLLIGTLDNDLLLYDTHAGQLLHAIPNAHPAPTDETQYEISAGGRLVRLIEPGIATVTCDAVGRRAATVGGDRSIRIWNLLNMSLERVLEPKLGAVIDLAFDRTGERLASVSIRDTLVWDLVDGRVLWEIPAGGSNVLFLPRTSPQEHADQRRLAIFDERRARIWRPATGEELATFPLDGGAVSAAINPDGTRLAVGHSDAFGRGRVTLWRLPDGERLLTLYDAPAGAVESIAFSPDGQQIAASGAGFALKVWSIADAVAAQPSTDTVGAPD